MSSSMFEDIDLILNDTAVTTNIKKDKLDKFYSEISDIKNDSLRNQSLLKLSYRYLKNFPDHQFLKVNNEAYNLAKRRKDTTGVAATYWDLAEYYHNKRIEDSAYYYYTKSQRLYETVGNEYSAARLLLQMGNVESNIGNYTGSEISTAKAIHIFRKLGKKNKLYNAYNNLGITYGELEEFENAINSHHQALKYINKETDLYSYASTLNNIGVVYFKMKNFSEAIFSYNEALLLNISLEKNHPKLYAMLIDNLAFAKFSQGQDTDEILSELKSALRIREKNEIKNGIIISKIHLAQYYMAEDDSLYAKNLLEDALQISREANNTRDFLQSMRLLSEVNSDSANFYLKKYVSVNDSLTRERRRIRNKFTKIRLDTDAYKSETKELNQAFILTTVGFVTLILLIVLLYIIKHQMSKNKRLALKEQRVLDQKEIQDLSLALRDKFEEGAEQEKFRISRELHDGILGRIFGVRLSLDTLNEQDTDSAKNRRKQYIQEIQNISEDIRLISHKLSKSSKVTTNFDTVIKELLKEKQILNPNLKFNLFLDSKKEWNAVEDNIKINLYRIIQESITNIEKHAKASEVKISISCDAPYLKLNIEDDGVGFMVDNRRKGIGLKNIQTRVSRINGFLEILSRESGIKGTIIKIVVEI